MISGDAKAKIHLEVKIRLEKTSIMAAVIWRAVLISIKFFSFFLFSTSFKLNTLIHFWFNFLSSKSLDTFYYFITTNCIRKTYYLFVKETLLKCIPRTTKEKNSFINAQFFSFFGCISRSLRYLTTQITTPLESHKITRNVFLICSEWKQQQLKLETQ